MSNSFPDTPLAGLVGPLDAERTAADASGVQCMRRLVLWSCLFALLLMQRELLLVCPVHDALALAPRAPQDHGPQWPLTSEQR